MKNKKSRGKPKGKVKPSPKIPQNVQSAANPQATAAQPNFGSGSKTLTAAKLSEIEIGPNIFGRFRGRSKQRALVCLSSSQRATPQDGSNHDHDVHLGYFDVPELKTSGWLSLAALSTQPTVVVSNQGKFCGLSVQTAAGQVLSGVRSRALKFRFQVPGAAEQSGFIAPMSPPRRRKNSQPPLWKEGVENTSNTLKKGHINAISWSDIMKRKAVKNRRPDQNQVMHGPAKKAMAKLAKRPTIHPDVKSLLKHLKRPEWLHLMAYSLHPMKQNPQVVSNLGAAFARDNTRMMILEGVAKILSRFRDLTVSVNGKFKMIPGSEVIEQVFYQVHVDYNHPKNGIQHWIFEDDFQVMSEYDHPRDSDQDMILAVIELIRHGIPQQFKDVQLEQVSEEILANLAGETNPQAAAEDQQPDTDELLKSASLLPERHGPYLDFSKLDRTLFDVDSDSEDDTDQKMCQPSMANPMDAGCMANIGEVPNTTKSMPVEHAQGLDAVGEKHAMMLTSHLVPQRPSSNCGINQPQQCMVVDQPQAMPQLPVNDHNVHDAVNFQTINYSLRPRAHTFPYAEAMSIEDSSGSEYQPNSGQSSNSLSSLEDDLSSEWSDGFGRAQQVHGKKPRLQTRKRHPDKPEVEAQHLGIAVAKMHLTTPTKANELTACRVKQSLRITQHFLNPGSTVVKKFHS